MNLQEQTNRIKQMMNINESSKMLWFRRRLETPEIKDYLERELYYLTEEISPCAYNTSEEYLSEILEVLVSNFIGEFSDKLYDDDDMLEIDKKVWMVIKDKYSSYIINQFDGRVCED